MGSETTSVNLLSPNVSQSHICSLLSSVVSFQRGQLKKKKRGGEREGKEKTSKFLIKNHEKDCFEITFKIHNLLLVQGKLVEF